MSAGQIGSHFNITGAAISYHLRLLRETEIVALNRQKNFIYYRINQETMSELAEYFTSFTQLGTGEPVPADF